jgi:hypothetical protein
METSADVFSLLLSGLVALGLAAACGFRVFVPPLIVAIASRAGALHLSPELEWLASTPALVCLSLATALEIAGYYVPVVDNFLDSVATPAAAVAGVVVAAAVLQDGSPWFRWSLALIAGGSAAAVVQIPTVLARGASTLFTGGAGNHVVATGETIGATSMSVLAITAPVLVPLVILFAAYVVYRLWRWRASRAVLRAA